MEATMSDEQDKLMAQLQAQYGPDIVNQAAQLSGLTTCLQALGIEDLKPQEREFAYRQAGFHIAQLIDSLMKPEHAAKVIECAKRTDSAIDMWMLDDIEKRDGLPPA